jgi:hypothetical protein
MPSKRLPRVKSATSFLAASRYVWKPAIGLPDGKPCGVPPPAGYCLDYGTIELQAGIHLGDRGERNQAHLPQAFDAKAARERAPAALLTT